jgi:hypothetical protein
MSNNFLQDATGNNSSKRLWGSIGFATALLMSVALFTTSILKGDSDTALKVIYYVFAGAAVLFGFSVTEYFSPKKSD